MFCPYSENLPTVIETASRLPTETILLSSILTTTALSAYFHWRQTHLPKEDVLILEDIIEADEVTEPMAEPEASPYRWHSDGATRTGKVRTENQDDFAIHRFSSEEVLLVVCDGAGGIEGGGEAARSAVEAIVHDFKESAEQNLSSTIRLKRAIQAAREVARDENLTGITTVAAVHTKDDILTYATLGDGGIAVIWPDGMISQVLVPHHVLGQPDNIISAYIGGGCDIVPRTGTLQIEPDSTVMLLSDGSSDLLPYQDFAENRDVYSVPLASKNNCGLADRFLEQLEVARDPDTNAYLHSDNMTLVMAHLSRNEEA